MKKYIPCSIGVVCGLTIMFASGCRDELALRSGDVSDEIRFTAKVSDSPEPNTRGLALLENRVEVLPLEIKASEDSMFLHSEILDWKVDESDIARATRSNMIGDPSGLYDSFNVSAYHYTDTWSTDKAIAKPNYFDRESASRTSANAYEMDSRRYWPESGKMRFIAGAPFDSESYQMAFVDNSFGPYVYINVDSDASKHRDLIVAYSQEVDCNGAAAPLALNFKHALCCVQFIMADDMQDSRIKNITIRNVQYWGEMHFKDNMTNASDASTPDANISDSYYPWDGYADAISLDLTDSANPDGVEKKAGELITDANHSFMMFPQILPNGANIEITLQRKDANGNWGNEEMMFGYISGKNWPAGKIVRYRLSNERWWQEMQVSTLPAFTPEGGTHSFAITSFEVNSDGTKKGLRWTPTYEDPNNPGTFISERPSWYKFETDNEGSVDPDSIAVTVDALPVDHRIDLDSLLRATAVRGTKSNPYNLSTNSQNTTSVGTTANCYIADRPGWYIFPLVYGNGIEGGAVNAQSFNPNTDTSNGALQNFVNYLGKDISSPYILTDCAAQKSAITESSAKIVWQDKGNLIRSSSISVDKTAFNGNGGILFEITAADIQQGNCVIGLEIPGQTGKMMWSWHIWVTSFYNTGDPLITETIPVTNHNGNKYNLLYTYLGWCSAEKLKMYSPRTSVVKFTATTDDGRTLEKTLSVRQTPFVKYWQGSNTYYQWGRKDPFMPFLKSFSQQWYDSDGNFQYGWPKGEIFGNQKDGLKERIQNPIIMHNAIEAQVPGSTIEDDKEPSEFSMYTNLWDATYSVKPTVNNYVKGAIDPVTVPSRNNVKTVYDPCPPGYKVPPVDTFTGFTNNGNNMGPLTNSPKNWNGTILADDYDCGNGITTPHIYLMYTDSQKSDYISFPLTGYRDWRHNYDGTSGSNYNAGTFGYFWTAGAASDIQGYYLEMQKDASDSWANSHIWPLDFFWQLDAFSIRPCAE